MRAIQFAVEFDQLNISEPACMELLARRAQLSELKWMERILRHGPSDEYGEDSYLYMGTNQTRGQVMIMPELEQLVADQLSKEGAVLKERRKLKEERGLVRANPIDESKGKGKGKDDKTPLPLLT